MFKTLILILHFYTTDFFIDSKTGIIIGNDVHVNSSSYFFLLPYIKEMHSSYVFPEILGLLNVKSV